MNGYSKQPFKIGRCKLILKININIPISEYKSQVIL